MKDFIFTIGTVAFIALVIVILCAVFVLVAEIMHGVLMIKYSRLNKVQTKQGWTAYNAARALLDANGLGDVEVKQMGFWSAMFLGNRYSVRKRTIYLRKNIINQTSITAVGVAIQKVGLALLDKQGNKKIRVRAAIQPLTLGAPILFLPIVIVGLILDYAIGFSGLPTLIATAFALIFYIIAFIFFLLNIPIEKKGNEIAISILKNTNFMDEEEIAKLEKLFKMYITVDILDFIVALIKVIQTLFKLIWQVIVLLVKKDQKK